MTQSTALSHPNQAPLAHNPWGGPAAMALATNQGRLYPTEGEWSAILKSAKILWDSGIAADMGLKTEGAIVTVALKGWELGVGLMASCEGIDIIKGRPIPNGPFLSFLGSRVGGWIEWVQDGRKGIAECIAHRPGRKSIRGVFTWNNAVRAGLASKDTYQCYPADMLRARAESRAAWMQFSDLYYGFVPPTSGAVQSVDPTVGSADLDEPVEGDPIPEGDSSSPFDDDPTAAGSQASATAAPAATPAASPPATTKQRRARAATASDQAAEPPQASAVPTSDATAPKTEAKASATEAPAQQPLPTQASTAPVEQPKTPPTATQPQQETATTTEQPKPAQEPKASTATPPEDMELPFTNGPLTGKKLSDLGEVHFKQMIPGYRQSIKNPNIPALRRELHESWLKRVSDWAAYRGVSVPE